MTDLASLDWEKTGGLIPAVVQDAATRRVLMLGYMSPESLAATLATGYVTFYSRSRQKLWQKGETSGHRLQLVALAADCDGDSLLVEAVPAGPTCHTGSVSCFGAAAGAAPAAEIANLWRTIDARADAPAEASYTRRLLDAGLARQAQKVGEEGVEVALAAVTGDDASLVGEVADLFYHALVLLKGRRLTLTHVTDELARRAVKPGERPGRAPSSGTT